MKDGEDLPPLPSQRSGAKSFVASLVSTVRKMLPSSQQSSKKPTSTSPQVVEVPLPLNRVRSSPQKVQSMKDSEDLPPSPPPRSRAKSTVASSSRSPNSPTSAERSRASPRRPTMRYAARRTLNSTVRQALPEHFKFRILVIGKSGSGKSSLIKVVFKVDVTAAPERTPGKADIDVEFRPGDNRYLIVHECSGLDSPQDLQTIRNFITHRTDPSRSPSERLHAVW
ncbi:hypothetical protein EDB86DRAFT_1111929 [Lactarius hatsudake]|nr:hypothetical protein EDB86DRAFT_1111929 [Lactarius hatsudake]